MIKRLHIFGLLRPFHVSLVTNECRKSDSGGLVSHGILPPTCFVYITTTILSHLIWALNRERCLRTYFSKTCFFRLPANP